MCVPLRRIEQSCPSACSLSCGSADDEGIRAALDIARSQDSVTDQEDRVFMDVPPLFARLEAVAAWCRATTRMASTRLWATCWVQTDDGGPAASRSESDEEDDGVHGRLHCPTSPSERGQTGRRQAPEGREAGKTENEAQKTRQRRPRSGGGTQCHRTARRWRAETPPPPPA